MRDPNRIPDVLEAIRLAWEKYPDLRLGQLIVNAVRPKEPCSEIFSIEEPELIKGLDMYRYRS